MRITDNPADQKIQTPFVVYSDIEMSNDDNKTSDGWQIRGRIHVYSEYQGSLEMAGIMDRVYVLLHHQCLSPAGSINWLVFCDLVTTFTEPDGVTRHGVIRYTARMQEDI